MQITSVISLSLKVTLTAAFMILLVRSLLKLTADDTGSREYKANTFHFPSISVCPVAYENDGKVPAITLGAGKMFEDFRKLPSIRENVLADFTVMEPYSLDYSKYLQVSLNDEEQVQDLLNTTLDEIWQEFAVIAQLPPFPMMRCATLKMPPQYPKMDLSLNVRNDAGFVIMFWEFNEDGQSRMIFKPDFSNAKYTTFPMDGEFNALAMKTNKLVQNCEAANNTVKHFDCIQNYMTKQMGCKLPWWKSGDQNLMECSSNEDLENYIRLHIEILGGKRDSDLEEFGCLRKNCVEHSWRSWKMTSITNTSITAPYMKQGYTSILFGSLSDEADIVEEYFLYDWTSFLADMGGEMGLFLGASILSILESLMEFFVKKVNKPKQNDIEMVTT